MDHQGVFVGFETTHQRIDRAVIVTENVLDLTADVAGVSDRRRGVELEAGAAPERIALRPMIGDEKEHAAAGARHALPRF